MSFDPKLVREPVFFDTGVLMRSLGERGLEPESEHCRDLLEHCIDESVGVVVSTLSIAEILRHKSSATFPQVKGLTPVGFDLRCAETLADQVGITMTRAVQAQDGGGVPAGYWKFDALIVATALRWNAHVLVSIDERMRKLATKVGLEARLPSDLREVQGVLLE